VEGVMPAQGTMNRGIRRRRKSVEDASWVKNICKNNLLTDLHQQEYKALSAQHFSHDFIFATQTGI
jgi:hypothetical protein